MSPKLHGPRLAISTILFLALGSGAAAPALAAGGCEAVFDNLAPATPETVFNIGNSGGFTIYPEQLAGPRFTLDELATVSEIGGFLADCAPGPGCPGFNVQVWRATAGGLPDPSAVPGTFPLSSDGTFDLISYEFARMSLSLPAGTYFALFGSVGPSQGYLVQGASSPFPYQPKPTEVGIYHPLTRTAAAFPAGVGVRILAGCTIRVAIDLRPGNAQDQVNPRGNGLVPVAVLSAEGFDPAGIDPATVRLGATGTEAAPVRWSLEQIDEDGRLDLLLYFRSREMGLGCGSREVLLRAETSDGQPVEGAAAVGVLGCPARR